MSDTLNEKPLIFSWKKGINLNQEGSEAFVVSGTKYEFWFKFDSLTKNNSRIWLKELVRDGTKSFDLVIDLKFKTGKRQFSFRNFKGSTLDLGIVQFPELLEITCIFSDIQQITNTGDGQGKGKKYPLKDTENPEKIKNDATKSTDVVNNATNMRNHLLLAENLKSAFMHPEDSDYIINIGNKEFRVHKVILKARSPVFREILKYDIKGKKERFVDIQDCNPNIFKEFLLYLYTGEIEITWHNANTLYFLSRKYDVEELLKSTQSFIENNLKVDTICDVIVEAIVHSLPEFLSIAVEYFVDNVKEIVLTIQWQKFLIDHPVQANELMKKVFSHWKLCKI